MKRKPEDCLHIPTNLGLIELYNYFESLFKKDGGCTKIIDNFKEIYENPRYLYYINIFYKNSKKALKGEKNQIKRRLESAFTISTEMITEIEQKMDEKNKILIENLFLEECKNKNEILNQLASEILITFFKNNLDDVSKEEIIDQLRKGIDGKNKAELLEKIAEKIIEVRKLIYVREMMKHCFIFMDECDKYEAIIKHRSENKDDIEKLNEFSFAVLMIIEELIELQDKPLKFTEIENIGYGGFSSVFRIGDKVLKLGKNRHCYIIPNSDKILQPYVRRVMKDSNFIQFIEVTEMVDEIPYEEQSEEKLYQFWKELWLEGIIWTDPKYANLGVLRKDNIAKLEVTISIDENKKEKKQQIINPQSVGLTGNNIKKRSKGEWVILDSDYLFPTEKGLELRDKEIGDKLFKKFKKRFIIETTQERTD